MAFARRHLFWTFLMAWLWYHLRKASQTLAQTSDIAHRLCWWCSSIERITSCASVNVWDDVVTCLCPAQLRDLYGPLLACVTATKTAYEAMMAQHR